MIRSIYYALLRYDIIFAGRDNESNTIFRLQKRVTQLVVLVNISLIDI